VNKSYEDLFQVGKMILTYKKHQKNGQKFPEKILKIILANFHDKF
jgi:hypothetical protein